LSHVELFVRLPHTINPKQVRRRNWRRANILQPGVWGKGMVGGHVVCVALRLSGL
jgi:hypothetical protein